MVELKHLVAMNGNIFELNAEYYEKAMKHIALLQYATPRTD